MKKFINPNFGKHCLELKLDNGEVCIYGTKEGLGKLAALCLQLRDSLGTSDNAHIHLEDREILTQESLRAVMAVFRSEQE